VLRFALTGAAAAAVQLAILAALTARGVPGLAADVAALLVAAQANFALSQSFTWGDRHLKGPVVARRAAYPVAIAGSALVNLGEFALVHHWTPALAAGGFGIAVAAAMNYAIGDRVVFAGGGASAQRHA
jgi:putative flippase GtrA